ncbi:hypothetical protein L2719_12100 [Shewanella schlegeliana]|uniref:Uncharacterized protein n=1 Tax=Shewanella schlegeliana TaxID=190308 RepID=A0ABS1ST94_9GAMM|nr:hypothetical protein [Shewanella schlegeliana]MBL4911758.1 hypothetical protein [Shewanella schlegeliana]MCL1110290.1 hypothetical protein [Shewanella schlegeliana]GIU31561.1 hypothetical protein TUM4433_23420 [Shewanella schlegeliana]
MSINATLFGQFILLILLMAMLVIGGISFYLGKRKTTNPILVSIIGALLAIIPPLGMIYVAALAFKKDTQD